MGICDKDVEIVFLVLSCDRKFWVMRMFGHRGLNVAVLRRLPSLKQACGKIQKIINVVV